MAKIIQTYRVISKKICGGNSLGEGANKLQNQEGILKIYQSENLHPGEYFIVFKPNDDSMPTLKTSCGKFKLTDHFIEISTMDGGYYAFELLQKIQRIEYRLQEPDTFLHSCCACGREEILSSKNAFQQGWDYPGKDGVYRDYPNYGFGMLSPRTCPDCRIDKSLYWKVITHKKLSERDLESLVRIMNEPMSLISE